MKTFSTTADRDGLGDALARAREISPQVSLLFAAPGFFADKDLIARAFAPVPQQAPLNVIGCSTAGQISAGGVSDNGFSLLAMHFDATEVKTADAVLKSPDQSRAAGQEIGKKLAGANLSSIFVLSPGLNVNGSEFTRGILDAVGRKVVITGGLAGDGTSFAATQTLMNGQVYPDRAVAFGLYGDKVSVRSGSRGGWKPFGPIRRVTKAAANILYEIDGKPALRLYKDYLGDKAKDLPASGLLYPFSILREDNREDTGIIRTILAVDEAAESLVLAGDMPQGGLVRLMHADTDSLVDGARDAAAAAGNKNEAASATLLVSCVGRKIIMGSDVEEEVEAVIAEIGRNSAYAGFYSYGEICPFSGSGAPELHNQTMTITHISEAA
ncbi:MAG TPA: FIST N-terminal domain-containing protein [Patescibacteria group bacterium]|nr:FIST N-terminal domain-containing protein [Patescibacteria group bacterium]